MWLRIYIPTYPLGIFQCEAADDLCSSLKGHGHGSESPHTSSVYRSR